MLTPESEFSHFHAVAIALETIASRESAEVLFRLLNMDGVRGHAMTDIKTAKKLAPAERNDTSTRNNSLRELMLGRALFRVGDLNGLGREILDTYSKDLRGHYYRHASGVLKLFSDQKRWNWNCNFSSQNLFKPDRFFGCKPDKATCACCLLDSG
jgi:hypothetical protein